jgi:hypothetical protein
MQHNFNIPLPAKVAPAAALQTVLLGLHVAAVKPITAQDADCATLHKLQPMPHTVETLRHSSHYACMRMCC